MPLAGTKTTAKPCTPQKLIQQYQTYLTEDKFELLLDKLSSDKTGTWSINNAISA